MLSSLALVPGKSSVEEPGPAGRRRRDWRGRQTQDRSFCRDSGQNMGKGAAGLGGEPGQRRLHSQLYGVTPKMPAAALRGRPSV